MSRFNRASAAAPFKVSPEFARVVRFALDLSRRSQGAFDPTLGPVVNLWGFGEKTDQRAVPPEADLLAALRTIGWKHLAISANDELTKDLPALNLNLSAVAKGFGADVIGRVLTTRGFRNWYAAIASEVVVSGHNPRGGPWQVGISAPTENWREGDPMAVAVRLSDQAISTSGDYQRCFLAADGRRLRHVLDPRTGWPVQNKVGGVSVVASDAMTADGLATTLFVLGPEAGPKFVES
jgi:thiamine biosynthesis lipoprotein